mgnify:CR=1 FL=1
MNLFSSEEYIKLGCNECAVLMLKPDSVDLGLQAEIMNRIRNLCKIKSFLAHKTVALEKDQIKRAFLHTDEKYISYLCSGLVEVYLVEGENVVEDLYWAKHQIRREFGVQESLCNLIHTSDCGNELYLLLQEFFPNYIGKASGNCDYCVSAECFQDVVKTISNIRDNPFIKYFVFNLSDIKKGQWQFDELHYLNSKYAFRYSKRVYFGRIGVDFCFSSYSEFREIEAKGIDARINSFISWFSFTENEISEYLYLIEYDRKKVHNFIKKLALVAEMEDLKKRCYKLWGMTCFCPGISLAETELRMEVAEYLGLIAIGGSYYKEFFGKFSVSISNEFEMNC